MSSNYYPNGHKLLFEWIQIHIELIKQNFIRLTTGIRWRNLHVLSTCEQQRPLSPCHSATFVKETAREALVFKLQLLSSNYSSIMKTWGILLPISLNFQCGDTNVYFGNFWMPSSHLLIFFFWYSQSWCSANRHNAKAMSLNQYISETIVLDHASQLTCALILPFEYSLKRLSMSICQEPIALAIRNKIYSPVLEMHTI